MEPPRNPVRFSHLGPPTPQGGTFGLFTDTTPTTGGLVTDVSSKIYVWANTLVPGTIAPYEGANGLSWQTNGQGWFGAGIMSIQPLNLFDFPDGHLKFMIKIPAGVTFKIGVIDSWSNQNYVEFPANTPKYGLIRNGEWGQASIPVSDLRGTAIDLRMLSYAFVILEEHGTACEFALDDIYWDGSEVVSVDHDIAPRAATLLASVPNPFTTSTDLRFQLSATGPYVLEVYDVAGKRVASFRGIGRSGANAVRWNGRDDQGHYIGPGIYYSRLISGGRSTSRKVVRLE
jgi:hypothetical protein